MGLWVLGELRADLMIIWENCVTSWNRPALVHLAGNRALEHKKLTVGSRVSRGIEERGNFLLKKKKKKPLPTKLEKGETKEGGILLSAISCCCSKPSKVFWLYFQSHLRTDCRVRGRVTGRATPRPRLSWPPWSASQPTDLPARFRRGPRHIMYKDGANGRRAQPQFLPG